jgi:hypothetical protein
MFVLGRGDFGMLARLALVMTSLVAAGSALAEPLNADAARHFVVGKLFAFNCFDGTRGAGRVYGDGSVAGNIQFRGNGAIRYVALPAGTLLVKGEAVCASLRGLPFEPCFNLNKTDPQSFRGSLSGLSFAYCDFTNRNNRSHIIRTTLVPGKPLAIHSAAAAAPVEGE